MHFYITGITITDNEGFMDYFLDGNRYKVIIPSKCIHANSNTTYVNILEAMQDIDGYSRV